MKILAIDPSTSRTGLVYPDRSVVSLVTPKDLRGPDRLHWLREYFRLIFLVIKGQGMVVLEDYAIGASKGGSIIATCEWGGVLRLLLYEMDIPFVLVPPQAIKTYCTGKGNSGKDLVCSELSSRTGLVFNNPDESDAYGLAALANDYHGDPWVTMPAKWRENAFKQVQWDNYNLRTEEVESNAKKRTRKGHGRKATPGDGGI